MRRIGLAVVLALGLALAPLVVEAQEISKSARVGVLSPGISPAAVREGRHVRAFLDALAQLGYREGQNLVLELRSAERQTTLAGPAQELVQLKVDVIVAGGVASARSVRISSRCPYSADISSRILASFSIRSISDKNRRRTVIFGIWFEARQLYI